MGFADRLKAIVRKETIQLARDRLTFAMMFGMPIMQLLLFGFAINNDPKGLPTAIIGADHSEITRSITAAIANTGYFNISHQAASESEANLLLQRGEVQFVLTLPSDLTRRMVRRERAQIAVEADATDPATTGNALQALDPAVQQALRHDLKGPTGTLSATSEPIELVIHRRYNPEGITRYNVVPGLLGVVLTMTMIMMTALAVTRERERGTMENLLAMPVRATEVMVGKIAPFIIIGAIQVGVILIASKILFDVPIVGSLVLLGLAALLFITLNLAIGFTFSTVAENQLQAMQLSFFFLLPSILLSGFAFPFRGMPGWAQTIGETLPVTHFLRIVRGVMLKGASVSEVMPEFVALALLLVIVMTIAVSRYRVTLD